MKIADDMVVSLDYQVTDTDGNLVDAGAEPLRYLHGDYDDIFPKLQAALNGKQIGDRVQATLQPDEAFGEYDADLVEVEPRGDFRADLRVGAQFEGAPAGKEDEALIYRVMDIEEDRVVLDANHPLAGMALVFTCTVAALRPARPEEIAAGGVGPAS